MFFLLECGVPDSGVNKRLLRGHSIVVGAVYLSDTRVHVRTFSLNVNKSVRIFENSTANKSKNTDGKRDGNRTPTTGRRTVFGEETPSWVIDPLETI